MPHIPRSSANEPSFRHLESHFTASETVRDVVIGMSDGLTVPFALAAGISGAIAASHIVVTAGIAELVAGGISMGLGGFLAARTEAEHFANERKREEREVQTIPAMERAEVRAIFDSYGMSEDEAERVTSAVARDPARWVDFMMKFELGLDAPDPRRAPLSALTIGGAYIIGGVIPLVPYMLVSAASTGLWISAIVTMLALVVFGAVKGALTGAPVLRSAFQTAAIGAAAAGVAFAVARLIAR